MLVCTFFGHRDCFGLDAAVVRGAIEELIQQGVEEFLVGHQGQFDGMVRRCLKSLKVQYPQIKYWVVLAYLPTEKREYEDMSDTIYPEIEGHPKFAIERRNRYLIDNANIIICYVNRLCGGAYKFARMAKRRGLTVINLGKANLDGD